jgi:dTDP-4-dehydrorhamnose 3,5-epimerase-like enzyme
MAKVIIEELRVAQDARGYVFEPLGSDFSAFRNVHVVYTVPGVVRGNHYHVVGTEVCSVAGPTLVRYHEADETRDVQVPTGQVWRFTFPPGVAHAFRNNGTEPNVLAAFNTEVHDPARSDAVRVVLLEP